MFRCPPVFFVALLLSSTLVIGRPASAQSEGGSSGGAPAVRITAPDIAAILNVAFAWFSDDEDVLQTGGHDPQKNGFNFQQLEISLGSSVDPYFRFDANLVFSPFGVEVEEAYATTLGLPAGLQVRAGQFLTRFGRLNPTHPHSWAFVDQPLVNGKFLGSEGNRGLGVELSWLMPLPWFTELIASATDAGGECCARSFYGGESIALTTPLELQATAALKQFWPFGPSWSMSWGLSSATGPNATGNGNRTWLGGSDLYIRYKPVASRRGSALSLQSEVMLRRRQVPRDVLQDFGVYSQLVYDITRRWSVGARYELVSGLENDTLDPDWSEQRDRVSALVAFRPSHFSAIRLQGARGYDAASNRAVWAGFATLEVVAGAHGSHTF